MGRTLRRRQLTGCRRRQPLQKATSCNRGMHLSHTEVGFRDFIQSLFAVTCQSSRSAMQAISRYLPSPFILLMGGMTTTMAVTAVMATTTRDVLLRLCFFL